MVNQLDLLRQRTAFGKKKTHQIIILNAPALYSIQFLQIIDISYNTAVSKVRAVIYFIIKEKNIFPPICFDVISVMLLSRFVTTHRPAERNVSSV